MAVLERNWDAAARCTLPNPVQYPHRWLWDSCFHAVAWAALHRPEALIELESVLGSRLPTVLGRGFLPHMVYRDPSREGGGVRRGVLRGMSSFTQPPVHVLALSSLIDRSYRPPPWLFRAASDALDWLWRHRLHDGLLTIVHPWESGADVSPRFDAWYGALDFHRLHDHYDELVRTTRYDEAGTAVLNPSFMVAPSAFNAIAADAARRLAELTGASTWRDRSVALSAAIDDQLWEGTEALWSDRADAPQRLPSASSSCPTLDGALGALATPSRQRAASALGQCVGEGRFAAPFGPRYLPADHPAYNADVYWRGPAWPQLNFLLATAATRHGLHDVARELAVTTVRGAWRSGFSEYWNPETGDARGATPQSWTTIAVALAEYVDAT